MFTFEGFAAHAGGAPWRGRSAADAANLMEVGWNYRREHLRPEHRSHYVIVHGGNQPNVVPSEATVWYFFREWNFERISELHRIGATIAKAAAMMTDTTVTEQVLGAAWPGHYNKPICDALFANIERVGMPDWSDDDQRLASAAQANLGSEQSGLRTEAGPISEPGIGRSSGSDDIAEVSWNIPTVVLRYPGNIPGLIGHHWSSAIAMATPIAHKGSTAGAKAYAITGLDLLLNPSLLASARDYFAEQTSEVKWTSLIPPDANPPIKINREKMERFRASLEQLRYDPARHSTYMDQLGLRYPTLKKVDNPGR
ncbi:MAG: amidohydrolase [bacterium]|nr:amidohydrolase [bacterium]